MDVTATDFISTPPSRVAAVMFDARRDPEWIGGAKSVEVISAPLTVGGRVRRTGGFLGRRFSWVTETTAFEPDRRLALRFLDGPMKGEVIYGIEPISGGSRASVRNHAGGPAFLGWLVKRSVQADLRRLKAIVESST